MLYISMTEINAISTTKNACAPMTIKFSESIDELPEKASKVSFIS